MKIIINIMNLSDVKKDKLDQKLKPMNLKLKDYNYDGWFYRKRIR